MENLTAAIPTDATTKELSAEGFRNLLSSWFEEKGIVSDLKSHVRYRMINILKNTAIGRDIVRKSLQKTSLSRQAVNLIVAEYLMQNHYHYTLSIFNTEAGLTDIFPVSGEFNDSNPAKFDPDNVRNIMELIGISKMNILSNELLSSYYTDQDASILSSLVTLLHRLTDKRCEMLDNDQYPGKNCCLLTLPSPSHSCSFQNGLSKIFSGNFLKKPKDVHFIQQILSCRF